MAGGPLYPISSTPLTAGKVFPVLYDGGSNDKEMMLGVMASLDGDAVWRLAFKVPPSLPTGTAKLVLHARANATSGNAKPNVKWLNVAAEEDPGGTVQAEGVDTITWASGDADVIKELKVTLDADTAPAAGETVYVDLTFETSSWTLAAQSGWQAFIIWE